MFTLLSLTLKPMLKVRITLISRQYNNLKVPYARMSMVKLFQTIILFTGLNDLFYAEYLNVSIDRGYNNKVVFP